MGRAGIARLAAAPGRAVGDRRGGESEALRERSRDAGAARTRSMNAEDQRCGEATTMSRWAGVTIWAAAVSVMALGCSQGPAAPAATDD